MLLQFTVENYLSFDEPTTFSMRAGKDKDLPHHLIGSPKYQAVKGAAIYGANAAGKSNLVVAMEFALSLIKVGRAAGKAIGVRPFGTNNQRPSGFHWQFVTDGTVWSYGFDVTNKQFVEEYLFARNENGGKETKWFERHTKADGSSEVTFGASLRGTPNSRLAKRLELIVENLRPEQPFLNHAIENKVAPLQTIWEWFERVHVLKPETAAVGLLHMTSRLEDFLEFCSQLLCFADTGISQLLPDSTDFRPEEAFRGFPAQVVADLQNSIENLENDQILNINEGFIPRAIMRDESGELVLLRFKTKHTNGEEFPLEWESDGTLRLLHLAPVLFALQRFPIIYIIDELDRRLHTLLVQEFVKIALAEKSKGQLIFTVHDTNLLDNWLLRRDEIHFVQKENGRSTLSRLSEWNVRSDLDYEKAYLRGSFEGRPYFGFAPQLQGLDVPSTVKAPSAAELQAQLKKSQGGSLKEVA